MNSEDVSKNNKPDDQSYLIELYDKISELDQADIFLKCTIKSSNNSGFTAKTHGLFGFIYFKNMPWQYPEKNYWENVSKHLISKQFYCKIEKIEKYKSIELNARTFHYKTITLEKGKKYQGVVLNITKYGVFLEVGYFFEWKYGSIVGLIHRSTFKNFDLTKQELENGQIIEAYFTNYSDEGKLQFEYQKNTTQNSKENIDRIEHFIREEKVFNCTTINKLATGGYLFKIDIDGINVKNVYLSFNYVHPKYNKIPDLIKNKFKKGTYKCKIIELNKEPFKIKIRLVFDLCPVNLFSVGESYNVYIFRKTDNLIFFDAGYHFGWQYGEQIYKMRRTKVIDHKYKIKTVISIKAVDLTSDNQPIFE